MIKHIAFAVTLFVAASGCHTTPLADVIDCSKLEQPKLVAEFTKLLALVPNWQKIGQTAISDAVGMGYEVVGCAIADLTQQYLTKSVAIAGDTQSARQALEDFRQAKAPGATFKVAGQNL